MDQSLLSQFILATKRKIYPDSNKTNKIGLRSLFNRAMYMTTSYSNYASTPQHVGVDFYRKKSSWSLIAELCPCDLEFAEYLKLSQVEGKTVFHFGTGSHHIVGIENQKLSHPNQVIGITACNPEHQTYVDLTLKHRDLAKNYTVLCKDIYTLNSQILPMFDFVSLFHLSEFYDPQEKQYLQHNDASLLDMFLNKLNPDGKLLFYTGSYAWEKAYQVIQLFEAQGRLKRVDEYKNLVIYSLCELKSEKA